jgi:protein-S-isoprenylcysteine O-methyltransferase Ste14
MEPDQQAETARKLKRKMLWIFPLAVVVTGLMLFLPAGSLRYWQAWMLLATLFPPVGFVVSYFLTRDPGLLVRRMQFKEKERDQRIIVKLANIAFFLGFLFPGLDHRYGWSGVPAWASVLADALVFLGYVIVFFVFRENSYTSRIVEVVEGQKVVTTGPYSLVRHPMYAGIVIMYLAVPIALGSWWALAFFVPVIALIVVRALDEERVLMRDLVGYPEYTQNVRYRLVPGVW